VKSVPVLDLQYRPRLPARIDDGIALIGCGEIANYAHLPAYKMHGLRVVGCYDINRAAAEETAARHGIPRVYETLDAALADPEAVICDIAVPAWHQRAIAEQARAAGKHLLCQKPLAENLADAEAIVNAARRARRKVAVNQQMRWSPAIAAVRDLIRRGFIGQPTNAQILVSIATPWHMWPWLQAHPHLDLMYHSIHSFDSLRCLFGDPAWVTSRHAHYPGRQERAETKKITVLDYDSGLQALIAVNHRDHSGDTYATCRFVGTEGVIKGIIGLLYDYPHGRLDSLQCHWSNGIAHGRDTDRWNAADRRCRQSEHVASGACGIPLRRRTSVGAPCRINAGLSTKKGGAERIPGQRQTFRCSAYGATIAPAACHDQAQLSRHSSDNDGGTP
jgi:predicted dehydrogenase